MHKNSFPRKKSYTDMKITIKHKKYIFEIFTHIIFMRSNYECDAVYIVIMQFKRIVKKYKH